MTHDKILIVDFGSQVTQLIARRVREEGVYCEIVPFQKAEAAFDAMKPRGVILSGGPESVHAEGSPRVDWDANVAYAYDANGRLAKEDLTLASMTKKSASAQSSSFASLPGTCTYRTAPCSASRRRRLRRFWRNLASVGHGGLVCRSMRTSPE